MAKYVGNSDSLAIPSELGGYTVTGIGDEAFSECTSLTSITIPDSVTSIGDSAFDNTAYYNDSANWENGVLYIGNHLIDAKTTLSGKCRVKNGTICIADSAFYGCGSLTLVTIPNSVTGIGGSAFYGCTSLATATIPNSVTSIGASAFYGCTSLASVTIPDSVTSIGDSAFYNTAHYNDSANWENGVLYIGNHLIKAETTLSGNCIVKKGTICIADRAFYNCTKLTLVTLPNSVTSIGDDAFYNCTGLTEVYYAGDENSWNAILIGTGNTALTDATRYYNTPLSSEGLLYRIEDGCATVVKYVGNSASLAIPSELGGYTVTGIGGSAFDDCTSLTSITIPDSVTSIGEWAFEDCTSLTAITIPDGVASIGYGAFYGCTSLTMITIPNSITSIGGCAFEYTAYYKDSANWENDVLYIGNYLIDAKTTLSGGYTIKDGTICIADRAFYHWYGSCTSLTSITIPDSVTSIGDMAFYNCTSLTDVYFGGSESEWSKVVIGSYNSPLTGATMHFTDDKTALGDVNGDGVLSTADVRLVLGYMIGDVIFTDEQAALCDVDGDGEIKTNDARLMLMSIL